MILVYVLAAAVPLPPVTSAPAWPTRRPGGAVVPAPLADVSICFIVTVLGLVDMLRLALAPVRH